MALVKECQLCNHSIIGIMKQFQICHFHSGPKTLFNTGVSLVLPLGSRRLHIWHFSLNANSAICATPRVIPGPRSIIGIMKQFQKCYFHSGDNTPYYYYGKIPNKSSLFLDLFSEILHIIFKKFTMV